MLSDPVQDKFVTLNGLRFHYRDWGDAHAPVIVALHGSTSNAHGWDTSARALCNRWR
jgi:pimeloyl-ACP methyl ester carboxylesterase